MSVLGAVQQVDEVAGSAAGAAAGSVRAVDEAAGSAVEGAASAVPTPGVISQAKRAVSGGQTVFGAGVELYARGMLVTLAWVVSLAFWPVAPVLPVLAGLLTVYLYGL